MEESLTDVSLWIKFGILFTPFVIAMFVFSPSLKWKILLSLAGAVGILLALTGKSMRQR